MFTGALRRAIVVKAHPEHAATTLKIISNRAPLPWSQKKPILTSFISSSHKRTFKTHLEFQDKTSATLGYLSPVALSTLIYSLNLIQMSLYLAFDFL